MIMIRYLLNFIRERHKKDLSLFGQDDFRGSGDLDRRGEGEPCPVSVCFSMSVSCHFPRMDPVIRASCSLFTVTGHNQALRPGNTALHCLVSKLFYLQSELTNRHKVAEIVSWEGPSQKLALGGITVYSPFSLTSFPAKQDSGG